MKFEKIRSGLKTAADKIADLNEYKFYGETTVKLSSEDKKNNKKNKCADVALKTDVSALEVIIAGAAVVCLTAAAAVAVKKCIEKKYLKKLKKDYVLVPVEEYYCGDGDLFDEDDDVIVEHADTEKGDEPESKKDEDLPS